MTLHCPRQAQGHHPGMRFMVKGTLLEEDLAATRQISKKIFIYHNVSIKETLMITFRQVHSILLPP